MNEIVMQEVAQKGVAQQYTPPFNISIANIFEKINPSDESFYKYIPKEFLVKENAEEKSKNKAMPKKGEVRFEEGAHARNTNQRKLVALAKHLARAIGIDIVFYDSTIEGTAHADDNGYFDPKDNSIHLDLQRGKFDKGTIAFTLSHELVHFIKKWSPARFNTFADFLMEQYAEHGVDTSKLLANKMGALGTTDADLAYEEMIADACERMLLDSNAAVKLMELRKTDLSLFEKIKQHILKILNDIRAAFKGVSPNTEEGVALLEMEDVLSKLHALFEDAALEAAKNYQTAEASGVSEGGGEIKHSLSKTKLQALQKNIDDLGALGIRLNAADKTIKVLTDKYTKDKNIFSTKGRNMREVNARIKAIPLFDEILKKCTYKSTDTEIHGLENEAKKGVVAIHRFTATHGDFDVEALIRDKGKQQFLYEMKFIEKKKSPQQSMATSAASPAPKGDVENGAIVSHLSPSVKSKEENNSSDNPKGGEVLHQKKDTGRISAGMSDGERANILKGKSIVAPMYEGQAEASISANKKDLDSSSIKVKKAAMRRIAKEFGAIKSYSIKDIDMQVSFSNGSLDESEQKAITDSDTLARLMPVIEDAVENAIGVEVHDNRYFADTDTILFHELLGGYVDGEEFVPVRFGVKESRTGTCALYIVVCQEKISLKKITTEVKKPVSAETASVGSRSVNISIAQFAENVNSKNTDILRYLPDDLLTKVQISAKYLALAKTVEYTNEKNDRAYAKAIESGDMATVRLIVENAAKLAGYTIKGYHGTPNGDFTIFRDWQYFTPSEEYAERYQSQGASSLSYKKDATNPKTYRVFLKINNAFDTRIPKIRDLFYQEYYLKWGMGTDLQSKGLPDWLDGSDLAEFIEENGYDYDAILLDEGGTGGYGDEVRDRGIAYVIRHSDQIKSSEPIVYDDNGNIIPISKRFDSKNSDIRYQKKTVSDRMLLAGALESVAQNDLEKDKIAQYKEKIALYDAEQAKLTEIRARIKELSFSKGKRDTETIKKLQFEANKLANRISVYDSQLLRLEASAPLQRVLEREKLVAKKKAEQKGGPLIKRERSYRKALVRSNTERISTAIPL